MNLPDIDWTDADERLLREFYETFDVCPVHESVVCGCQAAEEAAFLDAEYCSICDGLGHGFPGGPPCPLEDDVRYRDEVEDDLRRAGETLSEHLPYDHEETTCPGSSDARSSR